jgi:DNA polymerase-3 subunit delta'
MWPELIGHEHNVTRFCRAIRAGRLASTFLFVGPSGIGKRTFALRLAAALLCERRADASSDSLDPCGVCGACHQVAVGSHPDLEIVAKPPDKSFLPIELFVGDREHRGREGLCHRIALKTVGGGRRVAIIDDADALNIEGANCLLKTLEEPPPNSVLILIATSASRQLPTIRSRCQLIRFDPLSEEQVAGLLVEQGLCEDISSAVELARLSDGSLEAARAQAVIGLGDFRLPFLNTLGQVTFDSVAASTDLTSHINQAGKEASIRRRSLREVIHLAARFYRELMRALATKEEGDRVDEPLGRVDIDMAAAVQLARGQWLGGPETAAASVERCLLAQIHLDSNANLSTLIECWIDDLAGIPQGKPPTSLGWFS